MMPRLVLVHGVGKIPAVGQSPKGKGKPKAADPRTAWLTALAAGGRDAGHAAAAKRLASEDLADVVYASYRDLFFDPQAQGADLADLDKAEEELLVQLMTEVIEQHRGVDDVDQVKLESAKEKLRPEGQSQGTGHPFQLAIDAATTLLDAGPWRTVGQWATANLLVGDLAQVARYLARAEPDSSKRTLDQRIRARVAREIGPGPTVVVAHSLGTIVTYELLSTQSTDIPLWVTIGSPLAMSSVVQPRLAPRPLRAPPAVRQWLNFWDRDDLITAKPILENVFGPNDGGVSPRTRRVDSDGLWVHDAIKYLAQPAVAGPVIEALLQAEDKR
jgi:ElaB/YqjD/DUF883 family membrane-anchored ribosome-binding protein